MKAFQLHVHESDGYGSGTHITDSSGVVHAFSVLYYVFLCIIIVISLLEFTYSDTMITPAVCFVVCIIIITGIINWLIQ